MLFPLAIPYLLIFPFSIFRSRKKPLITAINDCGVIAIKIGQFIATRSEVLSQKTSEELLTLQNNLPTISMKKMLKSACVSFGCGKISDIFSEISEVSNSSASLAQVYKAKIKGEVDYVAVKILKPGIKNKLKKELKLIKLFVCLASLLPFVKKIKIREAIDDINDSFLTETDLLIEASAISKFHDSFSGKFQDINMPQIRWPYTCKDVITMTWMDGVSMNTAGVIESIDQKKRLTLARNIMLFFIEQIYSDGFFHADPHQGNFLVGKDGSVSIVDFGRMGFIDEKERSFITAILHAFINRDYDLVAQIHIDAGYVDSKIDIGKFALSCRVMGEKYINVSTDKIDIVKAFEQITSASYEFGMRVQKHLVLLTKTIAMIQGIALKLDPDIDVWKVAEPRISELMRKRKNPFFILREKLSNLPVEKILAKIGDFFH